MNRRQITAVALAAVGATTSITIATAAASTSAHSAEPRGLHRKMPKLLESIALRDTPDVAVQPMNTMHASIRARKAQQHRYQLASALVTITKDQRELAALQAAVDADKLQQAQAAARAAAQQATVAAAPPTTSAAGGAFGLTGFLACVAFRESHDDPSAVNASSGAGGLFQFMPSTWASLGEPGLPEDAPASVQIAAAEKLYAEEGAAPWAGGGYSC